MRERDFIRETLEDLKARDLYRSLVAFGSAPGKHVAAGRRRVLQFASNNYLGLANDPRVRKAARKAIERWGWGAGASRLVTGHTEAHEALEADLAVFKHTEAALVFPTGYQTNLGVVTTLVGRGDLVLCDRRNHASIYDAVKLSGATLLRYAHGDADDASRLLDKHRDAPGPCAVRHPPMCRKASIEQGLTSLLTPDPYGPGPYGSNKDRNGRLRRRRLLVTDTVFSMDGDLAPLEQLASLCQRAGCMLVLDEAHATGVLGPTGAGLAEALAIGEGVTASVATLSKALGGIGGFVAASKQVCDLLVNRARPFIYTTALPPAACEAARAALKIVLAEPERRRRLLGLAEHLRSALRDNGFDTGRSETPIVPIIVGDPQRALALASALLEEGIFCPAIRPPTVPAGTSRLRVSLTAEHTEEDVNRLVASLVKARG